VELRAVTVYEECVAALRGAGAGVTDGHLVLRFNLFLWKVHDRTFHECAVTVG
jgi:hypothetical protein